MSEKKYKIIVSGSAKRMKSTAVFLLVLVMICCTGCVEPREYSREQIAVQSEQTAYVELNGNLPDFTEEEKKDLTPFERYSPLDGLGRCQVAFANICQELMPTEERGAIGQVRPSGWHTVKYNDLIDGNYLYNRCHLIGYQLAGENANELNLITGTRYMNVVGMLDFENAVSAYVKETNHHVLYRVTPVFEGEDLLAKGVEMEAWSVEDQGAGICFHVFCYNIQPGITIDYATGESWISEPESSGDEEQETQIFILNKNTKRFHLPDCASVSDMADKNKQTIEGTAEEIEKAGYSPCARCLGE